jgi:hypothetical protein
MMHPSYPSRYFGAVEAVSAEAGPWGRDGGLSYTGQSYGVSG